MVELLAPAGNRNKLNTAFHFGADAVYVGGLLFSLRAFADNFDNEGLADAIKYAHSIGKKVYVAVNIFPYNNDFVKIDEYFKFLESVNADAVIVSDLGVLKLASRYKLPVHISTQANTTNGYSAKVYEELGANRIVLAREVSLDDIKKIRDMVSIDLEIFVHGAMCISYSGRCLLSNYLSDRNSNKGECVQACRWEYLIKEKHRDDSYLTMVEDNRGTYILNSKDLNMLSYIKNLVDAGASSFKIEGRMKSGYYVGNVVNTYRRLIDSNYVVTDELSNELLKNSHRGYTTGFYLGEKDRQDRYSSQSEGTHDFVAEVIESREGGILVEQRNRFRAGDTLEILSNNQFFNKQIFIDKMYDKYGNIIDDAKLVQQEIFIPTEFKLNRYDILRKKINVVDRNTPLTTLED